MKKYILFCPLWKSTLWESLLFCRAFVRRIQKHGLSPLFYRGWRAHDKCTKCTIGGYGRTINAIVRFLCKSCAIVRKSCAIKN